MMSGYKKIYSEKCASEKYVMKSYFKTMTVADSRMAFKIENFVVPTIRLNFKSDKKFKAEGWLCPDCREPDETTSYKDRIAYSEAKVTSSQVRQPGGFLDSQIHVIFHCTANVEIRNGKSMENIHDQITLMKQVVSRRNKKQDKLS